MNTPRKVAILGGGMGSLSAAFWLTSEPGWQERYDVTVYQMGWRLGGKAASSRNAAHWHRNEEHGYHMLFGFYENTFRTMRLCYEALDRSPDEPLAEFCAVDAEDEARYPGRYAMKRNSTLFLAQEFKGATHTFDIQFPPNAMVPGDGVSCGAANAIKQAWDWLWWFERKRHEDATSAPALRGHLHGWLDDVRDVLERVGIELGHLTHETEFLPRAAVSLLAAGRLIDRLPEGACADANHRGVHGVIIRLVRSYLEQLWDELKDTVDTDWVSYRTWIVADLFGTVLSGVLADDLLTRGFDCVNHENYYEWIRRHATVPEGTERTVRSVLVQFAYDACFAYENGDAVSPPTDEKPLRGEANMEAGTLLRGQIRLLTTYKGSVDWLFQGGAGEVLIAPMYEVLRRRGVKFEFFHKVTRLVVDEGSRDVDAIEVERQVNLRVGNYQPLVMVHGIPAWPSEPLFDQIAEGDELRDRHVDLESFWTDWTGTPRTLRRGVDYDDVVLGIPVGSFRHVAQDLCTASPAWQAMTERVKTIRTVGFQTWMDRTLEETGWDQGKILTGTGVEPIDMEADATHIIPLENWPRDRAPKNLTYFGGPMKDDPCEPAGPDPAYPPTQRALAREEAIRFLDAHAGIYWPDGVTPRGFRWEWLVDLESPDRLGPSTGLRTGRDRFESQFWKANIDPSERYVLSVVGSSQYRLEAGHSGFCNLYLAGDWVKTGLNCGCMEATVMSGMQAARALGGWAGDVPGECDGHSADARLEVIGIR